MQIAQQSTTIRNMIIASAIILALSLGIRHAFALYLEPMSHHFGWGHQVFSLAIASQNLIWGLAQPFTGALADRYGSRIVVAIGGLLYMIGLAIMAVSSTGILLNLSLGLILGIALSASGEASLAFLKLAHVRAATLRLQCQCSRTSFPPVSAHA